MLSCPQQITYVTLKTTEQINNQILGVMEEAEVWHCKVFMETLTDNSNLSSLIKYKCVSVLCTVLSLTCSLTLSHTYTSLLSTVSPLECKINSDRKLKFKITFLEHFVSP